MLGTPPTDHLSKARRPHGASGLSAVLYRAAPSRTVWRIFRHSQFPLKRCSGLRRWSSMEKTTTGEGEGSLV